LSIYFFDKESINVKEVYLLSNNEYININERILLDQDLILLEIPNHWDKVHLMLDDSIMQTCMTIFDSSVFYSIKNDIIPFDSNFSFKMNQDKSSIWMNEILWNPNLKKLQLELSGKTNYDTLYSVFVNDELLWELTNSNDFHIQYIDSLFTFSQDINLPIILTLRKNNNDDDRDRIVEYITLDSISFIKNRLNGISPWIESEKATFGSNNNSNENLLEDIFLPEFFILYQNYPNPFNGETRITFDLLEDAIVSLYVIDAKGRVHDKFIDNEYITSGNYNYNWVGDSKSTGIYFFTIHVTVQNHPPTVLSRKMIYLK